MNNKRKNLKKKILDIVTVFLCVCLVGSILFATSSFLQSFRFKYEEDSFYYTLEDGRYTQMVEMYHNNVIDEETAGAGDFREFYGVAKYFEAASYYVAYERAGDAEKAKLEKEKMNEALEQMGELSFVKKDIEKILGL